MAWPLARSSHASAPCTAVFDAPSLTRLGTGSVCIWLNGGQLLVVLLGMGPAGVGLANGTVLRSVSPLVAYENANTALWNTEVTVIAEPGTAKRSGTTMVSHAQTTPGLGPTMPGFELTHGPGPTPTPMQGPCVLLLGWQDLVGLKVRGEPVLTGGLGLLAEPPDFLVWACLPPLWTVGRCPTGAATTCFRYNESGATWEWMGADGPSMFGVADDSSGCCSQSDSSP